MIARNAQGKIFKINKIKRKHWKKETKKGNILVPACNVLVEVIESQW